MKTLIIAEKPSVAGDIARALKVSKKGDFFENDAYLVTSAIGHLVELEMPEDIDPKLRFWRLEALPILPGKFGLKPSPKTKERFLLLKKLLHRNDITEVINACDAGREGELIFAYIYQLSKAKLPVKRAWMQTMTPDGIRTAFDSLRDGTSMAGLENAARCRSESDWLIGINGTRALTKRMFGSRAGNVATVGRVQTPTLAIVVNRELEIRNFIPRDFWRITATFHLANGIYEGAYQRPDFKKRTNASTDEHDRVDRIWSKEAATAIHTALCAISSPAAVHDEKKATTQAAPRLYDLTTLQREANSRHGLPARTTLQVAQALYERHKAITYPRTDSRALPEDYIPTCKQTLAQLAGDLAPHAQKALDSGWVRPNRRIFNSAQVSDHFAIIPTGTQPSNLSDTEARIYDMIARRFVAAFHPAAEYDVTTRTSTLHSDTGAALPPSAENDTPTLLRDFGFKSEGKVLTFAGWLAVYGKSAIDEFLEPGTKTTQATSRANAQLPAISSGDGEPPRARASDIALIAEATKPPPRYNEATLLSAMEGAGKLVNDEELADAMKERGLGTPATRAEIIEGLVHQNYLERSTDRGKRDLTPTTKAEALLEFLAAVKADALTKPNMTGEWEYKLRQMEHNAYPRDKFMDEIVSVTKGFVEHTKNFSEDEYETHTTTIPSPSDKKPLLETLRSYKSQDGIITIYKVISGRKIEEDEVRTLVTSGEIGPLDGFISARTGNRFPAKLRLIDDEKKQGCKKVELDFGNKVDLQSLEAFWTDPASKAELCESATNYILRQRNTANTEYKELFKVGRLMCQKPITREHAIQLVTAGKTDLIEGFISKKGRPFNASLLRKGARINWEFPPREKTSASGKEGSREKISRNTVPDLSKAEALGTSKSHSDGTLYRTDTHFVVTKPRADDTPRVVFKIQRTLCGLELPSTEIQLLLNKGKTHLLEGMVSKKGKAFSAFLVLSKDKTKAEFEFPPR
ncbi:MAG: topoisomerase C-terminal repeat-containing protein [Puniceicoccales bacterium]|jgi:DNA topoisomerase-3|nr:topoisomerase C-terminal repeat-containing protein [Puniceicoccales bacterium]